MTLCALIVGIYILVFYPSDPAFLHTGAPAPVHRNPTTHPHTQDLWVCSVVGGPPLQRPRKGREIGEPREGQGGGAATSGLTPREPLPSLEVLYSEVPVEAKKDSRKIKIAKRKRGSPECQRFQEVMGRLILLTPKWHSMLRRQRAKGSTVL